MKLSIVTTLYYSAPYIQEFYNRITASAKKITDDYEIIFVNDGSPDDSLDIVKSLYEKDKRVTVIDLSRNFGHHKAIMTGLTHAKGHLVFLIDCDLEEKPESLEVFFQEWKSQNGNIDVIYGIQKVREGNWFRRWAGDLFYRVFNSLSGVTIPNNLCMTRLMTKRYVKSLLRHKEKELVLSGLFQLTGFDQKAVSIRKRYKGKSTYNIGRKIAMATNTLTSFSSRPLELIFILGCGITTVAVIYSLLLIFKKLFFKIAVPGYTSLIVSIWFIGGIIILFLGVLGLYIARIFLESKERPRTIIREIYQHSTHNKTELNDNI